MPHIGLSDTATASEFVTDSAAGMTAIVTGQRTHNGVLGEGPDTVRGKKDGTPLTTILELAEKHGLATGFISNDGFTGATPAALYAKVNDRKKTAEIFRQGLATKAGGDGIEVMIGPERSDVVAALKAAGTSLEQLQREHGRPVLASLEAVPADATRAVVLLEDNHFDVAPAIALARRMLAKNPRGYFLMVESDAHTDAIRPGLDRLVAFDRAIRQVAASVGPDTLLLFTADHSFGLRVHDGVRGKPLLTGAPAENGSAESVHLDNVFMDDTHTGEEVLVAAQGPGSERVHGYLANTDLFRIMVEAFGW
jgi:alkaline phosphatase